MLNFPDTPIPGQVFNPGTGSIYTWDGVAWNLTPVKVATARARNRVNNPTAQVSQELGSSNVATSGAYPADQWVMFFGGVVGAAQRGTSVPSPEGTNTCVAIFASTAKPSLAATDHLQLLLPIEGSDVPDFMWGAARALPVVLRFSAQCDTPGTYAFAITNFDGSRSYCGSFTLTSNLAQTIVVAIPGDTTGTWKVDGTLGVVIRFCPAVGSNYVGVAGWQAGLKLAPPGCGNIAAVVNNVMRVTDVGLYLDPEATGLAPPFNAPSIEDDLARCMRYWSSAPVSAQAPVAGYAVSSWYTGVPMRASPTLSVSNAGASNVATIGQDTVTNNRGGLFQISASANGGYVIGRIYSLTARLM